MGRAQNIPVPNFLTISNRLSQTKLEGEGSNWQSNFSLLITTDRALHEMPSLQLNPFTSLGIYAGASWSSRS